MDITHLGIKQYYNGCQENNYRFILQQLIYVHLVSYCIRRIVYQWSAIMQKILRHKTIIINIGGALTSIYIGLEPTYLNYSVFFIRITVYCTLYYRQTLIPVPFSVHVARANSAVQPFWQNNQYWFALP